MEQRPTSRARFVARSITLGLSSMRSARNTGFCGVFGDMASLVKHLPHYQEPATLIPVSYTHLTPADERSSVDLGGRRIITKKKTQQTAM